MEHSPPGFPASTQSTEDIDAWKPGGATVATVTGSRVCFAAFQQSPKFAIA